MADPKKRILVADDDPDLLTLTSYRLRSAGFRTTTARDGLEALRKIVAERPGLAVLDHRMPGLDGGAVLRIVRAQTEPPPVLFLTASADARDVVAALGDGAVDYLMKPIRAEEFVRRCRAALAR